MKIKAYQICYSPETFATVPEGFHALDYLDNSRPDWREFWPIRQFLLNNFLADDVLYGFFSPKFFSKTSLSFADLNAFISSNYINQDVVIFSPFWDLSSIFTNVYEQGDFFHAGLLKAFNNFSDAHLAGFDVSQTYTHSKNTIFCNYFFARKSFWLVWLDLATKLHHSADIINNTLSILLNDNTNYGIQKLPMKIFLQERLATTCLLLNDNLSTLNYDIFKLNPSITPFNKFYFESVCSDALKVAYSLSGDLSYINSFSLLRDKIFKQL
jgi:hypothetical protein